MLSPLKMFATIKKHMYLKFADIQITRESTLYINQTVYSPLINIKQF